jgi:hypothetical protein
MKTTLGMTKQTADSEPVSVAGSLSLTEFNRLHGVEIRQASKSQTRHRSRQRTNLIFEAATMLLVVSTFAASFISLITMK